MSDPAIGVGSTGIRLNGRGGSPLPTVHESLKEDLLCSRAFPMAHCPAGLRTPRPHPAGVLSPATG
jgi:hypothetical protein